MRSVNEINITNWTVTGANVPFPQYQFNLEIKWTDENGVQHTHGPQQYRFPNDIANMPLEIRRAFAEQMIIATARVTLGVNSWEDYR